MWARSTSTTSSRSAASTAVGVAYGQSKLANLLFTFELDRRLRAAGSQIRATAAHPGHASTHLQTAVAGGVERSIMPLVNRLFAQDAAGGALPTLYAAVADVPGGSFAGPSGFGEQRGNPKLVKARATAHDEQVAARLWTVSEQLTGGHLRVRRAGRRVTRSPSGTSNT